MGGREGEEKEELVKIGSDEEVMENEGDEGRRNNNEGGKNKNEAVSSVGESLRSG